MSLPSDELHKSEPITFKDFEGLSIHDALIVQTAIRKRLDNLRKLQGTRLKIDALELSQINVEISLYISEEIRREDAGQKDH